MPASRASFRILPIVATAALVVAPASCARPADPAAKGNEVAARVDSLVAGYQRRTHAPGISVAVIRGGRDTLVMRGYGLADVENGVRATPETVYPVTSVSKQFTAAAVMRLAEQKRLTLDDPIGRHLPELPAAWRGIPVRHFLNHTSGVPHESVLVPHELPPDSVVARAGTLPLDFAPGAEWRYSNVGYVVLGLLIEKVSGEPYGRHLEARILGPNGLASTRYCDAERIVRHRAAGYEMHGTTLVNAPYVNLSVPFGAGALCSTAGDLARWNHALATGRVVSPASWARMTTPEGAAKAYGFGLMSDTWEGHRIVGHSGSTTGGFRSSSFYLPDDSLSVAVLSNLYTEPAEPLALDIIRAVLGTGSPPAPAGGAASLIR